MVRLTKIYTRTGDKGFTSLAKGRRLAKTDPRIETIGCIDELNAFIGLACETLKDHPKFHNLCQQLIAIQHELFNLGSQLSVLPEDRRADTPRLQANNIDRLEQEMDAMNELLPVLESFILPGGSEAVSRLHVARAICRRSERMLAKLAEKEQLDEVELPYLNRLSDWLFVAARLVALNLKIPELLW